MSIDYQIMVHILFFVTLHSLAELQRNNSVEIRERFAEGVCHTALAKLGISALPMFCFNNFDN